mmetsp:Transcript_15739/g.43479  ORF Transcript_15739/g.43479 Transcript_15739/m.43479 type:complete len:88 (+) Transcript_15739:626-889(+)
MRQLHCGNDGSCNACTGKDEGTTPQQHIIRNVNDTTTTAYLLLQFRVVYQCNAMPCDHAIPCCPNMLHKHHRSSVYTSRSTNVHAKF